MLTQEDCVQGEPGDTHQTLSQKQSTDSWFLSNAFTHSSIYYSCLPHTPNSPTDSSTNHLPIHPSANSPVLHPPIYQLKCIQLSINLYVTFIHPQSTHKLLIQYLSYLGRYGVKDGAEAKGMNGQPITSPI